MSDNDKKWFCNICNQAKPVPSLARDCEAKHERETAPWLTQ